MFYGTVVWDPWLIVAQIVCIQCLYYIILGVFMGVLVGTRVSKLSLFFFFDFAAVTLSTVTGWCVIASFILSSVAGAGILLYLIERAKKCLDFAATLYIIHLCICIFYGGWPSSITWWVVNGTGLAIMALLGEYLCIQRELREIPISRLRSMDNRDSSRGNVDVNVNMADLRKSHDKLRTSNVVLGQIYNKEVKNNPGTHDSDSNVEDLYDETRQFTGMGNGFGNHSSYDEWSVSQYDPDDDEESIMPN